MLQKAREVAKKSYMYICLMFIMMEEQFFLNIFLRFICNERKTVLSYCIWKLEILILFYISMCNILYMYKFHEQLGPKPGARAGLSDFYPGLPNSREWK